MNYLEFDTNQFEEIFNNRYEHQKGYLFNLRIKMDTKILNEACEYFAKVEINKHPKAIQLLFYGKRWNTTILV